MSSPPESNYGSELDYTDEALAAQLEQADWAADKLIKQLGEGRDQSLWERYRQRRGWGSLSVSDFATPAWCEVQHTYRLESKSWLPVLERPPTITTSTGVEISIDRAKAVKRDRVLERGTAVHSTIERQVMGDVEPVTVETDAPETWWALRVLNTIVSLVILLEQGRVREVPVVGFVREHVVFGVIDQIERREFKIAPQSSRAENLSTPSGPSSGERRNHTSKKPKHLESQSNKDQPTLLRYFSPSPMKATVVSQEKNLVPEKGKNKETIPSSDDRLFEHLTSEDDLADLAALAEIEELELRRQEFESEAIPRVRLGYVISDTKSRFNRSIPPEPETLPSRIQLMLYHRLFTSLVSREPEHPVPPSILSPPPYPPASAAATAAVTQSGPDPARQNVSPAPGLAPSRPPLVPTGPFEWSRLYAKFRLDPDRAFGPAFVESVRPVLAASSPQVQRLLEGCETLGQYVKALGTVGTRLKASRDVGLPAPAGGKDDGSSRIGQHDDEDNDDEVLEGRLEITYVVRPEDENDTLDCDEVGARRQRGKSWKGRRSARKHTRKSRQSDLPHDDDDDDDDHADTPGRDEDADLQRAIELSLDEMRTTTTASSRRGDDESSLVANPTLPVPLAASFALSSSLLPQSTVNGDKPEDVTPAGTLRAPVARDDLESVPTTLAALAPTRPSPTQTVSPASPSRRPPPPRPRPNRVVTTPPSVIGTSRFALSPQLLSSHLAQSLSYWHGEREPVGVSIEHANRCRTCEFEDGCEWRQLKADELAWRNNVNHHHRHHRSSQTSSKRDRQGQDIEI